MAKVFVGRREAGEAKVSVYEGHVETAEGNVVLLDGHGALYPLQHYPKHSPTGFEWGYGGSGPADLARCLLIEVAGVRYADFYNQYHQFKFDVVAGLDRDTWTLTEERVDAWVAAHPVSPEELAAVPVDHLTLREQMTPADMAKKVAAQIAAPSHNCRRCHRGLKSKRAQARGYGDYCWKKALGDAMVAEQMELALENAGPVIIGVDMAKGPDYTATLPAGEVLRHDNR